MFMKKFTKKHWKNSFSFLMIWAIVSLVISIVLIILAIKFFNQSSDWCRILADLVTGVIYTLIITGGLGFIIELLRRKYFNDVREIKKLHAVGIEKVGDGFFKREDERKMFGTHTYHKNYPYCLKFMFITGNLFLGKYKQEIINCMNEGCRVQILLANPKNKKYLNNLERMVQTTGKTKSLSLQYNDETLRILQFIKNNKNKYCKGSLTVEFYNDEYMNSFRAAKYTMAKNDVTHYWVNVQSLSKWANDFSVALKGTLESTEQDNDEANFFENYENGFDFLWNKYHYTKREF